MSDLLLQHCVPQAKGSPALTSQKIMKLHTAVQAWQLLDNNQAIEREFKFKNYYETLAFVNAVAWIAHQQDHHPDMSVSYNRCRVRYHTHSVAGLSLNDFICAAMIDALIKQT